jgi:hypothetical protein
VTSAEELNVVPPDGLINWTAALKQR